MALSTRRAWLVTYDITHPKRLSRLHRFLRKHAMPVQFTVFHYEGSAARMGQLVAQIETRIDSRTDDVRIYQLPRHLGIDTFGRGGIPVETHIFSEADTTLDTLLPATGRRSPAHCWSSPSRTSAQTWRPALRPIAFF